MKVRTTIIAIALTLACGVFASTPKDDPKVRPGHNPAKVERGDSLWRNAAAEVQTLRKEGYKFKSDPSATNGKLIRGNPLEKIVSLTFDDGPHPKFTDALLAILKKEDVRATFFTVGKMGEKYPELLRHIVADGHEIGNHTFSHATLSDLSTADVEVEYEANNDVIKSATGIRPTFCRPPGGRFNDADVKIAQKLGMITTLWTDDPGDYLKISADKLEQKVLSKVTNGGIILLHSGVQQTLDVLPKLIQSVRLQGYRFVSLTELEASVHRQRR